MDHLGLPFELKTCIVLAQNLNGKSTTQSTAGDSESELSFEETLHTAPKDARVQSLLDCQREMFLRTTAVVAQNTIRESNRLSILG